MSLVSSIKNKEDPENYRPVSLFSVPETFVEQIVPEKTSKHVKDSKMVGSSQGGFMQEKSCLSNMMAFYSEMIGSVDARRAVNFILSLISLLIVSPITSL